MREILRVRQTPNKFKNHSTQKSKSVFEDKTLIHPSQSLKNRTLVTSYSDCDSSPSHTKNKGIFQLDTKKNHPYGTRNMAHNTVQENAQLPRRYQDDLYVICDSKSRESVYDIVAGEICCHFCSEKKICKEENGDRCVNGEITKA